MDTFAELTSGAHAGAAGIGSGQIITAEQARASNYKKGRVKLHGFDIAIETPAGQRRTGKSDGQPWSVICMAHYGDITGTKASDGDPLDVFIGPWPESERVYVVNRVNQDGAFDEVKILMGFPNVESALTAYKNSYERGAHGLSSYVPCSIDQLKWWIKFGDTTKPITTKSLPHDGSIDMNETAWDSNAMPVGTDLPGLMYKMRRDDMGDNLLLDSVSVADIMEDSDGEVALDALVIPFNRLERKMTQMQLVMKATGESVKPVAMQVTPPFKQRGTTNVAVVYELSDGQTVSVYFHNPDSTPNKLTPDDEMVSWKWLLNKKDITILVAPERGQDLNPREVARRIMRIAERNSARFQAANTKRAERMAGIEATKQLVASQEEQLQGLYAEIDSLESKVEAKRSAAPAVEPVAVAAAVLQNEIRDENGEAVGGTVTEPTIAPAEAPAVVESQAEPTREPFKAGERVFIKPEFQDRGDELFVRVAVDDEDGGRLMVRTIGTGIAVAGGPTAVMEADMLERRTPAEQEAVEAQKGVLSAEGYAVAQRFSSLLELHQDTLDSFFQERLVAVRNAMRDLDWFGPDKVMTKGDYRFTFDVATVGAGSNVVGIKYQILDAKDVEVTGIVDDLTKPPAEIAAALDSSVRVSSDADTASLKSISVTNHLGTTFNVVRIDKGDSYGADGSLVYEKNDPQVDIYQAGPGEGFGKLVASYRLTTFSETEGGLHLRFPDEKLALTPDNVSEIKQWLGVDAVVAVPDGATAGRVANFVDALIDRDWELAPTVGSSPDVLSKGGVTASVVYTGDSYLVRLSGGLTGDYAETEADTAAGLARLIDGMLGDGEVVAPSLEVRMTRAAQGYDLATGFDEIQAIVDEAKAIGRDELVMVLATLQNFNQPIYGKYQGFVVGDRAEWSMTAPEFADFILSGSSAVDPDAEVVAAAVEAAKRGAGGITRLVNQMYFTFDFDGEDLILSDELRAKVEAALGSKLVEKVFPGFELEVALVPAGAAEVKSGEGQLFTEDEARAAAAEVTAASGVSSEEYLADTAFLQSAVDGTVDMLASDFADRLTALYDKYESDAAMMELFNKAAEAYSSYMVDEARRAMG